MSARCFSDTCSIETSELSSPPSVAIDVKFSSQKTIECANGGLQVNLLDEDVYGVDASRLCANILRHDSSGRMHAVIPLAHIFEFSDSNGSHNNKQVSGSAATGGSEVVSQTHSWTNNTGCTVLIAIAGTFNLDYAVLGPNDHSFQASGDDIVRVGALNYPDVDPAGGDGALDVVPFNAQWATRLLVDINNANPNTAVVVNRFSTSGMVSTFKGDYDHQYKAERRGFSYTMSLDDGDIVYFRGDIGHQGVDQTLNVVANNIASLLADLPGDGLGFRLDFGRLTVVPIGASGVGSI